MESEPLAQASVHVVKKRTPNHIFDLERRRSIGEISSSEFKRRATLNRLQKLSIALGRESMAIRDAMNPHSPDEILGLEVDKSSQFLLGILRNIHIGIYDVSKNDQKIKLLLNDKIPRNSDGRSLTPNSAHFIYDCSAFTVGTKESVHIWDTETCMHLETINTRTHILNHVSAKRRNASLHVAATGVEGHVFMIDLNHGMVVMTMNNKPKSPIKAIQWHPLNELYYATGNDHGNIYLWDIRVQSKYVNKFKCNDSYPFTTRHIYPVVGLKFYNNGNGIISVDCTGEVLTWEVGTGYLRPNDYGFISLCKNNDNKEYQFAVTENLKEDIAFLPTTKGLRIIDIESGKRLQSSDSITYPMKCATYDPNQLCVYSSCREIIKSWSIEEIWRNQI